MGKQTISSQELADYTHVNSTQIRRDLSGFGKFGKRGVGYNIDSLVTQIRKILHTSGQHNIALFGAGHLGHGDRDLGHLRRPRLPRGRDLRRRPREGRDADRGPGRAPLLRAVATVVDEQDIVVAVLAVPASAAQQLADELVELGREDHLQLLRGAARRPAGGHRAHVEPGRRPAVRAVLLPDLSVTVSWTSTWTAARSAFESSTDFTVGLEEEFAILDRETLALAPRFEELRAAADADPVLADVGRRRADLLRDRDPLRTRRDLAAAQSRRSASGGGGCSRSRADQGVALGATGTHPWADYREQQIIDTEHYRRVEDGLKYVAWRNNTFSLHVHVGIRGADRAVQVCDRLRPVLPVLLAISANSPFLDGRDSGLHSARTPDFTQAASRAAACPTRSAAGRRTPDYIDFLVATALDRRVHAGLVVGPPALLVRHGRGPDLRRAGDRGRSPRGWRR